MRDAAAAHSNPALGSLYIYGLTGYSFHMADMESATERHWTTAVLFFAAAGATPILSWRRHPAAGGVRFDGSEPVIQSLELSDYFAVLCARS